MDKDISKWEINWREKVVVNDGCAITVKTVICT